MCRLVPSPKSVRWMDVRLRERSRVRRCHASSALDQNHNRQPTMVMMVEWSLKGYKVTLTAKEGQAKPRESIAKHLQGPDSTESPGLRGVRKKQQSTEPSLSLPLFPLRSITVRYIIIIGVSGQILRLSTSSGISTTACLRLHWGKAARTLPDRLPGLRQKDRPAATRISNVCPFVSKPVQCFLSEEMKLPVCSHLLSDDGNRRERSFPILGLLFSKGISLAVPK
ncbi:hypothetical protein Q8A67_023506 [Cirrhinus molitorella]|uniref:Uncharacterized protein n=1 Tax=Cirrhinus molitorella TaxID=172907 RepID=A0AA88P3L0_9TELE|nr:hypothetical protein Q8A67_023506 [Cirrhinus molitorella]